MAIRNLVVNYPTSTTKGVVLTNLMEALTSTGAFSGAGAGMTLVEDSITGDDFFVVQADQPTEPLSRMILKVEYVFASAVDWIWVTPYEIWTPGAPGVGTNSVNFVDPALSPTTSPDRRSHRIDFTNGGNFYLDCDDTTGLYLGVHSEYNLAVPVQNTVGHKICVCSNQKSSLSGNLGVNYGVIGASQNTTGTYFMNVLNAANTLFWVPPVNHLGFASNGGSALSTSTERAAYICSPPFANGIISGNRQTLTGRGGVEITFDTYNDGELLWPMHIMNVGPRHTTPGPVGMAYGYRGIAHGLFGYGVGALVGWRSTVIDDDT